ncbi:hypothetical protein NQ314_020541 [Rhamnusium bicolor]|uniref:MADF domain-containing protein n=1 Tax=Rhamnusium bicolor TaxID=1586634 RepID=A0AAV8WJT3_9CUCU|nr:hypothetical protein NQ314_020541 [Rhamnusium bicolor]
MGTELQSKWKNLRTCFRREYDAQKKPPSGSEAKKRRKYMYFDQLLFLCNNMESRETTSNLQSPSSSHPNSDTENEEPNIVLPERPTLSNTRKKQTTKSYEESLLKILQEKKRRE